MPLCVGAAIVLVVCGLVVGLISMSGSAVPHAAGPTRGGGEPPQPKSQPRIAVVDPKPPVVPVKPPPDTPAGTGATLAENPPNWSKYRSPFDLAFSPDGKVLAVSDRTAGKLILIDAATGKVTREIALSGQPTGLAWRETGRSVLVCEYAAGAKVADIRLPAGGALVRGLVTSADGKWLYAVHTVGRTNLPTTQLERGWVNTNALTVVDLAARAIYATLLLDPNTLRVTARVELGDNAALMAADGVRRGEQHFHDAGLCF